MTSAVSSFVRRFWWLTIILIISVFAAIVGPLCFSIYIRTELDMGQFYARLGSDALTLAGFVLTSLAVIAKQIDRSIFDRVRLDKGFQDIWRTFALTAIVFTVLAIMVRASELFYVLDVFTSIIVGLFVFGILLLMTCIYLLFQVVSLINKDEIARLGKEVGTPVDLPIDGAAEISDKNDQ